MKNPISYNLKQEYIPLIFIGVSFLLAPYFYLHFPAQVPSHWDIHGTVDQYSSAAFAAFFFPVINLLMYLLLTFIPVIDPEHKRYTEFAHAYVLIKTTIIVFMACMYVAVSLIGLGYNIPIQQVVPVGVGILFIVLGN